MHVPAHPPTPEHLLIEALRLLRDQSMVLASMQARLDELERWMAMRSGPVKAGRIADEGALEDGDAFFELLQAISAYWGDGPWQCADVVGELLDRGRRDTVEMAQLAAAVARVGVEADARFEARARQVLGAYLRERKGWTYLGYTLEALGKDRKGATRWRVSTDATGQH